MRIEPVKNPQKAEFRCIKCNKWSIKVYADLDGKPFIDYYCETCKPLEAQEEVTRP